MALETPKQQWKGDDPCELYMIDSIFEEHEMGEIEDGELGKIAREQTRKHLIRLLSDGGFLFKDIEDEAIIYYDGFLGCLKYLSYEKLRDCGLKVE